MDNKPLTNPLTEDGQFIDPAAAVQPQTMGVRFTGNVTNFASSAEVRQPAKITMNIPHFQPMAIPKTIMRGQNVDFNPPRPLPQGLQQMPTIRNFEASIPPNSLNAQMQQLTRPTTPVVPQQMQSFRSFPQQSTTAINAYRNPQPIVAHNTSPMMMMNRVTISQSHSQQPQQQQAYYGVPIPYTNINPQFSFPANNPQRIQQLPETKTVISTPIMTQAIPHPKPTPLLVDYQQQMEVSFETVVATSSSMPTTTNSAPSATITPLMINNNNPCQIKSTSSGLINSATTTTVTSSSISTSPSSIIPINPPIVQQPIEPIIPANTNNSTSKTTTPTTSSSTPVPTTTTREPSPDKTVGKLRGPKCYRQQPPAEKQQQQQQRGTEVSLGPYQRPTNKLPVKLKGNNDIKREDVAMLVMPSEDWSCSVYPITTTTTNNRQGKYIYVISETLLNSDLIEIVRKSISIQPNWGMKFSIMATDAKHFNLGLDACDITDIQAILDNFDSFPICSGVRDVTAATSLLKPLEFSEMIKTTTLYCDRIYRSKECPILLVNVLSAGDKKCSSCSKLLLNMNKS